MKMVKQVLRKADKPRTALKELKKQYSNVNSQYQRMKSDTWQFSDLAASWYDRDRRKIQKKIDIVQKVVDKKTKPNNKDLSKSLWNVSSNKWMKKSDGKGMYKQAVNNLSQKKEALQNKTSSYVNSTWVWADAYLWYKRAKKDVEAARKEVASLAKYNKWTRVQKRK